MIDFIIILTIHNVFLAAIIMFFNLFKIEEEQ